MKQFKKKETTLYTDKKNHVVYSTLLGFQGQATIATYCPKKKKPELLFR